MRVSPEGISSLDWAVYVPLPLQRLGLILLQTYDAAALELAVMHDMVRLGRQHALHVVAHVAQDNAKPLGSISSAFRLERLDLEALQNRNGEAIRPFVVEDGAAKQAG